MSRFTFNALRSCSATVNLFALSSAPEVMWSIMMLFVVDKYARDFYMENAI